MLRLIRAAELPLGPNSGIPWPVLIFAMLAFALIQYVLPKLAEKWRSDAEDAESLGEAEKARYEGAARFVEATGDYGIKILEQLTKVQQELETERRERYRVERTLARAFGVLGILEEEINTLRIEAGKPPITDRLRRMFPDLYDGDVGSLLDATQVKDASSQASMAIHHPEHFDTT